MTPVLPKTNKTIKLGEKSVIKLRVRKEVVWPRDVAASEEEIRSWLRLPKRESSNILQALKELEKERVVFLNECGYWQTVDPDPISHRGGYRPALGDEHYFAAFGRQKDG